MTVDEFRRLVRAVVQSGDLVDCEGGVADSSTEIHAFEPAELKQLQRVFNSVDDDGSGELDYDELARVLEKWGLENVSDADVEQLVNRFDVNKNGKLDFDEFLGLATAAKSLSEGDGESMEVTIEALAEDSRSWSGKKLPSAPRPSSSSRRTTGRWNEPQRRRLARRWIWPRTRRRRTGPDARREKVVGELDDRFLTACEVARPRSSNHS